MRYLFLWKWCSFPPIWVIEEAREVSFPDGVALYSLQLLFPLQPGLCRRKLRGAVGYFKWLFCASLLSVSKRAKALQLACMGGDLGQDFSSAGETWPDSVEDWLPGLFVWNLFFFPRHMIYVHTLLGHPKEFPPSGDLPACVITIAELMHLKACSFISESMIGEYHTAWIMEGEDSSAFPWEYMVAVKYLFRNLHSVPRNQSHTLIKSWFLAESTYMVRR